MTKVNLVSRTTIPLRPTRETQWARVTESSAPWKSALAKRLPCAVAEMNFGPERAPDPVAAPGLGSELGPGSGPAPDSGINNAVFPFFAPPFSPPCAEREPEAVAAAAAAVAGVAVD